MFAKNENGRRLRGPLVVVVYGARLKRGLQQGKQAKGKPSAGAEVGEKRTGEKKKKKKMSWWWRMYTVG
jgi:hypothetical protein